MIKNVEMHIMLDPLLTVEQKEHLLRHYSSCVMLSGIKKRDVVTGVVKDVTCKLDEISQALKDGELSLRGARTNLGILTANMNEFLEKKLEKIE